MAKVRDERIDYVKALAILSVPVAHYCYGFFNYPKAIAFTAHLLVGIISGFCLPAFLFFSGWFHHDSPWPAFLAKSFRMILKPYFVTAFAAVAILLAFGHLDLACHKLLGIIAVNGSEVGDPAVRWLRWAGPIWFLPVLFWCRIIHKVFYHRLPGYLLFATTIPWIALAAGHWIPNYTFGLLPALGCIGYYSLGAFCHEKQLTEHLPAFFRSGLWAPALLLCGYSMSHYVLDISTFLFEPYPVIFISALCAIVLIYYVMGFMPQFLRPFFNWVGQNTLPILCYHTLAFVIVAELRQLFPWTNIPVRFCLINAAFTFGLVFVHLAVKKVFRRAT